MLRSQIEEIVRDRNWTLNTRIDYKQNFSKKDLLKIVCSCGKPQTIAVRSLRKYKCSFCGDEYETPTNKVKFCTLCEKPYRKKGHLCWECKRRANQLGLSIAKLLTFKEYYNVKDVFKLIDEKPFLVNSKVDHKQALELKRNIREYYRSKTYRREQYEKWKGEIPPYILNAMAKYPNRKFLTLSGDKSNPNVHYVCKMCGEEQVCKFRNLKKSHGCIIKKSSGETIVETFLKERKIRFTTQFKTLKCINPITGRVMPYDVEIAGKKILIEIQGEQHLKFIEYFHGTPENFEYQKRKDDYKRRWAERAGYKLLYIYYDDFKNNQYKDKIMNLL